MTDIFPKISIDISQPLKNINRKGNSNGASVVDYSKFQIKEPIITQQYNVAIEKNISQIQTQFNTEQSKQLYSENKSSRRLLNNKLNNSIELYQMQKQPKLSKERQNKTPKYNEQSPNTQNSNIVDKDNLIKISKYFTQLKEQELLGENITKRKSFLCQKLMDLIEKVIDLSFVLSDKIEQLQFQNNENKEDQKTLNERKDAEYANLEQKYEKLKENFFNQLNSQINQYKQKMEDLEKQNDILKSEKEKHTEQLTRIHENYDKVFYEKYSNYDQTLNEYKAIEKKFEMQNKDFNELKAQYTNIYETYRKTLNDLKMFKERNALNENKIQLLQTEIQSIQADNQIYKQTYTPRPNLIEVLEVGKIEYEKEKKHSTSQLVLILKNALSQKPYQTSNNGINYKTSLENIQSSIIPISPLKQPQNLQDKKRINAISLNSIVANNNVTDNDEQNFTSLKNQSKRLSPTASKSKQIIYFTKGSKDSSNVSATDIKKQKKKIAIDLGENSNDQSKNNVNENRRINFNENLQKESKSLQIVDHIKRRVKSTHQKEFQNRSTINISNMHAGDLSIQHQQKTDDNTLDNSLVDYSKRKGNKNEIEFDSKYNIRISQSQVYVDDQVNKKFQENYTPRDHSLILGNDQNNQQNQMKPKDKFLYYIQKRKKIV